MKDIEQLLANNKAWAEDVEKDMPGFFRKLENQHKPKFLWIGCSDSRVPADQAELRAPYPLKTDSTPELADHERH